MLSKQAFGLTRQERKPAEPRSARPISELKSIISTNLSNLLSEHITKTLSMHLFIIKRPDYESFF